MGNRDNLLAVRQLTLALLLASAAFGQVRIVIISADGTRRDAVLVGVTVDTTKSPWQIRPAAPVFSIRRLTRDPGGAWSYSFPAGLTLVSLSRNGVFQSPPGDFTLAGNTVTFTSPGLDTHIVAGTFAGTPTIPDSPAAAAAVKP